MSELRAAGHRSRRARSAGSVRGRATGLALALVLVACSGENLFTGPVLALPQLAPEVQITVPQAGFTLNVGDSLLVTANIEAQDDLESVTFSGIYAQGGGDAFLPRTASFQSAVQDTTLTFRLAAAQNQLTGSVAVIVRAEDAGGGVGADTVAITVQP